jgi:hypothetical protein
MALRYRRSNPAEERNRKSADASFYNADNSFLKLRKPRSFN